MAMFFFNLDACGNLVDLMDPTIPLQHAVVARRAEEMFTSGNVLGRPLAPSPSHREASCSIPA
jgi:hypothetical protein